MLKVLRDNVKYLSWILWLVIALFIVAIFVDFGSIMRQPNSPGTSAAKVGGEVVTREEFERQYRALSQRITQMYGDQATPELLKQLQVPRQALDHAVEQTILLQEARRSGFQASDSEVRDAILQFAKDDQGRFIGEERYTELLLRNGYTVAAFEDEMRKDLLLQKLDQALLSSVYLSDVDVERGYRDQVERAKIRYVELPRARFLQGVAIPQNELAAYFQAHRQEYRLPERRAAAYLLVEPAQLRDLAKVDDAALQRYYDQHHDEFTRQEEVRARQILFLVNDKRGDAEAKRQLEEVRKRIERGEDFGAVARQVSEDEGSKANGGDLGVFSRGRNIKEFDDAAFAAPVGKLIGPVKSPLGYHLIRVDDHRQGGVQPLAEVRERIRAQLAIETSRQLAETKARELARQIARDKPKTAAAFTAFAKGAVGVSSGETGKFGQQEPVPGIGLAAPFNATVFALKKGEVSDALQVGRGWAIAYLEEIDPPHLAELSEVEAKARAAVTAQKQQQTAMDRLAQARKEIDSGKSLDQVAKELGVAAKESPEFGGQGQIQGLGYSPQIAQAAMALGQGKIGGPLAYPQGALLFQVTEHKGWEPAKYAGVRDQTRLTLQHERLGRLKKALIEQRRREVGVTYNPQLLQSFGMTGAESRRG